MLRCARWNVAAASDASVSHTERSVRIRVAMTVQYERSDEDGDKLHVSCMCGRGDT